MVKDMSTSEDDILVGRGFGDSKLSIVTAAYNEEKNLYELYLQIKRVVDELGVSWEWIIVDDHSYDKTFEIITLLAKEDSSVKGFRLSRNSGSHTAMTCGLHKAEGECVVGLAADLQDPPETIHLLIDEWKKGFQVVWAIRDSRESESAATVNLSKAYHWLMRNIVGFKGMPETGADFFLVDRRVVKAFKEFRESNTSIFALITWMGFKQTSVVYDKQARLHGSSGWTVRKKIGLLIDSITSFSFFPIRALSYLGFVVAITGFIYAGVVVINTITGDPVPGWSALMVVTLLLCGFQMIMIGVLGEYIWRNLDESRRRPRYLIEEEVQGDRSQHKH
jgi:polyisoprenyl-phosphate glycosyltransferase